MELFDVLKERHSIRAFKSTKIGENLLNQILQAANSAPSAGNLQSYEIFLIREATKREKIAKACYNQNFVAQAPIVLVFCANLSRSSIRYGERGEKLYSIQDATIACSYAQLAATALGLASCWIGAFDEEEIRNLVNATNYMKPVAVLPIGYANEEPRPTSRRSLSDLVKEEKL
jgi:nitroreductase